MGEPLRVGVVGCGAISGTYLETLARLSAVDITAVADLDPARAQAVGDRLGVPSMSVDQILLDPRVDLILNLTIPAAHAEVALAAIAAGKSVYGEKPLAATTREGHAVLDAARAAGVLVGCAPDTVLGTGIQTARKAVDDGLIGTPIAATATFVSAGHESWHPNPDFYYKAGGGPLLDMGPYYVTALVTLLGPVSSVIGKASHTRSTRTIHTGPRAGEIVTVDVGTHVTGVLEHESGALSTLVMSFDAPATHASHIEVHGELGTLVAPDPNRFDGEVQLVRPGGGEWTTLPASAGYTDAARGYGLADLATTPPGETHRANGDIALHVLDAMESVLRSAEEGRSVEVRTTCERPSPVPLGGAPGGST